MSRQVTIIIGVIIVLLILGAGAFVMSQSQENTSIPEQSITASTQPEAVPSEKPLTKASFKELMTTGKPVSCQISYPEQNGSGTVYVSDNKMRTDFTVKVEDKDIKGHMIHDGEYSYSWIDGSRQGTKFKVAGLDNYSPPPGVQSQAADLNKQVDVDCSPWAVNTTMFSPPKDILFSDMSQVLGTTQKASGAPTVDKSLCDQIQDPTSKAACLKAF